LEHLAYAAGTLFRSNQALRNLTVGKARAEDAIKLAAFGVHANDYLALQEFLPSITHDRDRDQYVVKWEQKKYGHPGNWTRAAAEFSLKTFVDVALRIQDAEWIPGAIEFGILYEYKITALVDDVKIIQEKPNKQSGISGFLGQPERIIVKVLQKGESLRGELFPKEKPFSLTTGLLSDVLGKKEENPVFLIFSRDPFIWGEVQAEMVHITCVPRDSEIIRQHFPDLPEVEYEP
jgi:hypothetical protein